MEINARGATGNTGDAHYTHSEVQVLYFSSVYQHFRNTSSIPGVAMGAEHTDSQDNDRLILHAVLKSTKIITEYFPHVLVFLT